MRDLQKVFNPSELFTPWLANEKANRDRESGFQKKRRRDKRLQVKIGHGGTLDPLATGVLIIGVGKGTKCLQNFLTCTKAYETTLLFGAATDTYDVQGKLLSNAPYSHITKAKVIEALDGFKGKIMQRPPIYSALRIQGKHLYEYAREGKEVPVEIQERPVTVLNLEVTEWLEPGSHTYKWPAEEAVQEEKDMVEKVLHVSADITGASARNAMADQVSQTGAKRKRAPAYREDDLVYDTARAAKRLESDSEFVMSGALLEALDSKSQESSANGEPTKDTLISRSLTSKARAADYPPPIIENPPSPNASLSTHSPETATAGPPAVRLRMIVSSGFYVRSLCHDLGKAVGSLGIMAELVRTRQGDFELGRNALEYVDLGKGESVWGPQVRAMLEGWQAKVEGDRTEVGKEGRDDDEDGEERD